MKYCFSSIHKEKEIKPFLSVEIHSHCSPQILHQVLVSPSQERHRTIGVSPEEGHKDDGRAEHLCYEDKMRVL